MSLPPGPRSTSTAPSGPGLARTTGRIAIALIAPALGLAVVLSVLTAVELQRPDADALTGIGYVFAVVLAVPTLLALALASGGLGVRRGHPTFAAVLSIAGLVLIVVVDVVVLLWAAMTLLM